MTDVQALHEIAVAINGLTAAVSSAGLALWLILFFKNMGGK